ncbi:MAG: M56 family metallopeptidase [Oscillospiraceae bacterium]|nr:M56 family metallopeptidase [Oscillospiraceae bacterium]
MKEILITSTALILVLILLRLLFRRTISRRTQYALWLLVLLRLLIPLNLPAMKYSVLSAAEPVKETQVWETASEVYERTRVPRMSYTRAYGEVLAEQQAAEPDTPLNVSELESRAYQRMHSSLTLRDAVHLVWYVGMGLMALLILLANLRFALKLRRTRVRLEVAESRYPVYLCDDIPSPCLFGLCKPKIYVTSAAAKDPETLRYVIAHEETHARHLDPLWSLLRSLCLVIWWFDPLVWLAAHFSRVDCELACDEGVLQRLGEEKRIPYGETLLKLIPVGRAGNPVLTATTMTAGKRQMKDRIKRIAEHRRPLIAALVVMLALAAIVCACTFTGGRKEETPDPEPTPTETVQHTGQPATPADLMPRGEFESPGAYLASLAKEMKTVTCYAAGDLEEMTVPVLDTRVRYLNKVAEIPGLAPEETLEWYYYLIEVKPDTERDIILLDGMTATEDGWYDLEGQAGHSLVLLRYPDGSYAALHDQGNNDDYGGMYYYEETAEEMLYDWYVRTYRPDLPTWTIDLLPEGTGGNHPARRWESDGWYLYIPISGWSEASSGGTARWVSQYGTGSSIAVRQASREELTAERPALAEGQAERYIEGEDGRLWLVFTQYDPARITGSPEILEEPRLLEAMLESFTVPGGHVADSGTGEASQLLSLIEQLSAAADRIFGTYGLQGPDFQISVEANGRLDEYTYPGSRYKVPNVLSSQGYRMKTDYAWSLLTESEAAALLTDPSGPVLRIRTEEASFTVYGAENLLLWVEEDGTGHWLRPEPAGNDVSPLYDSFLGYAAQAEMTEKYYDRIAVPGTVTDFEEVARQVSEQYAALLLDRPDWCPYAAPYGAGVLAAELFDAYYGEDFPNFCFVMRLALDVDEKNEGWFQAGPGLGAALEEGPYAGWRPWWSETTVGLVDGTWRLLAMGSGGATVWLPYGLGWDFPDERLSTEQLLDLYFLTSGNTRDWRLMHAMAQKPTEELREEMNKLSEDRRQELLRSMEAYNENTADRDDDWYGSFDLEAYGIMEVAPGFALLKELSEYSPADWDRLSREGQLNALYESLSQAAIGDGQVRRDMYVMTAFLHADGACAELLDAILREQYETDPDAWAEALSAFQKPSLLLQMADSASEGDALVAHAELADDVADSASEGDAP